MVEIERVAYFFDQCVGNDFAGLVVFGIEGEHFGFECPIFVYLAHHFDKIARHVGAGYARIVALRQQAVQGVSEFVEQSFDFVEREQRRCVGGGFGEVAHVDDNRAYHLAVDVALAAEIVHPCAAAFAGAWVVVSVEQTDERSVGIGYFECLDVGVIHRHRVQFFKFQSVEFVCERKYAGAHIFHLEVGFDFAFVERIFFLTQFFGVVVPIPRFECESAVGAVDEFLQFGAFGFGFVVGCGEYFVEECIDGGRCFCHGFVEYEVGRCVESEHVGFFDAQAHDVENDLVVVVLVAVVAAVDVGFIDFFAQVAACAVLQERDAARCVQCYQIFAGEAVGCSGFGSGGAHGLWQSVEVLLVEHKLEGVVFGQQIVAEFLFKARQLFVYLAQAILFVGRECYAVAHKGAVHVFEHGALFGCQVERLFLCIDGCHAFVQIGIHENVVAVFGNQRQGFFHDGSQVVVAIGFDQVEQHACYFGKQFARFFVGGDGVVECRRGGVGHDGSDFGVVLRNAFANGRQVVRFFYFVERRQAVRRIPFGKKWIFGTITTCCKHK